jgi:hypothetical protein
VRPYTAQQHTDHGAGVHFVPVQGGLVFAVRAFLIVVCLVEFGLRMSKAWRKWEEE